jgi:hypothetical protein
MLIFLITLAHGNPQSSWLDQQKYTHGSLLPKTLDQKEKKQFLNSAHQYLIQKYKSTSFSCKDSAALHYPFSSGSEELKQTYALETSVCIPNITWKEAHSLYMDPVFRTAHMPGVKFATKNKETICVTSDSFIGIIKAAYMCLKAERTNIENGVLLYSHLTKTKSAPFQPIYFQEEYILFKQFGTDTLIHRLSINRSRVLGTTGNYVLRKKSKEYPKELINGMKQYKK